MKRLRFTLAGVAGFVFVVALGLASLRLASRTWAGTTLLLTLVALSIAILGVVYHRGARQAFWLGFALLGWGYMALASQFWWDRTAVRPCLVTTTFLERIYPYIRLDRFVRLPGETDPRDLLIKAKLEEPISMSFANETPLDDILKYIRAATKGSFDSGIPIYVDPAGLRRAGQTTSSVVSLDLDGLPLRTTLAILLKQLGLTYQVRDGLLTITAGDFPVLSPMDPLAPISLPPPDSGQASYLLAGHCYFGLFAAFVGGAAGLLFFRTREGRKHMGGG